MIYITGDTHGEWDKRKEFLQSLNKDDKVICLGDLGWSWDEYHIKTFQPKCEWLSVLGNHENYSIIEKLPVVKKYGGKCRQLKENVFYFMNGEMYKIEGKKFFVFGGALSIDKHWRTPYKDWWPQEQPTQGDFEHAIRTLKKHHWKFDYFLTHTGDTEQVQRVLGRQDTINDGTERMIQELKYQVKEHEGYFDYHFFGHLHEFWIQYAFHALGPLKGYSWYCLYRHIYNIETREIKSY